MNRNESLITDGFVPKSLCSIEGWGAVLVGGAALASGAIGAAGAESAAKTQAGAAENAQGISQQEFNTITQQETPYMQSGYGALSALDYGLGITPLNNQQAVATSGNPGGQQAAPNGQYTASGSGALTPIGGATSTPAVGASRGLIANNKASGGMVHGPGGPRSDSVPINASNGEFVVNAHAVSQPGVLAHLKALNGGGHGSMSNYANGGMVNTNPSIVNPAITSNGISNGGYSQTAGQNATTGPTAVSPGGSNGLQDVNGVAENVQNTGGLGYGSLSTPFTSSNFQQLSPAYNFQLAQGQQNVINGDASGQGALSGSAIKDATAYNQGMANTSFNNAFNQYQTQQSNIFNRLYDVAGLGQTSAANTGQQGTTLAGQQAQSATNVGTALAGGTVGAANSLGGALSSAAPWLYSGSSSPPASPGYSVGGADTTGTGDF